MLIIITSPNAKAREARLSNLLFKNGLHLLHLRLDADALREDYIQFILAVSPQYRDRIVIHDHYDLVNTMGLRGVHLKSYRIKEYQDYLGDRHLSVSTHSLEELKNLPFEPTYAFLSAVFDSISKNGYRAAFDNAELVSFLKEYKGAVVALGGVNINNASLCYEMGFSGIALLGAIWENPNRAVEEFRKLLPALTMSIAGFDPSGGAGLSSDLAVFQKLDCYGLAISTADTLQDEDSFEYVQWRGEDKVCEELSFLLSRKRISYIKIGIVESLKVLTTIVETIKRVSPHSKIILDPILSITMGGRIFEGIEKELLMKVLPQIYLITPNSDEAKELLKILEQDNFNQIVIDYNTNILLKGGHRQSANSTVEDILIRPRKTDSFFVSKSELEKHGTGCKLSAAICSYLSLGYSLVDACRKSQRFVSAYINSGVARLGHLLLEDTDSKTERIRACTLQYITDEDAEISIPEQVEQACRGGVNWVQFRMKEAEPSLFLETGKKVAVICRKYGAVFIVNDSVGACIALNADGVHLGLDDTNPIEARRILGYEKIIGGTCNTIEHILSRQEQGIDYIGLGPFKFTNTKKKLSPILSFDGIEDVMTKTKDLNIDIPIYAIGGIENSDIQQLMKFGIQGVVLSSLLRKASNMEYKCREVLELINN